MDAELKLEITGTWGLMLSGAVSGQGHADALESIGTKHHSWGLGAAGCSHLLLVGFTDSMALPMAYRSSEFSFTCAKKQHKEIKC